MDEADRTQRLENLLQIDERIAALESSRGDRKPLWKNAGLIAAYGGLLALVPASVTGVAGWLENRRELELATARYGQERTLAYLGLAVDADSTEAARAQVLRFLASLDGDPVASWAASELGLVEQRIVELVDEKAVVTDELEQAVAQSKAVEKQAVELQAQLDTQPKSDPLVAKQAASKAAEAQELVAEVQRKRDEVDALSTRIGDAPLEIIQMRVAGRAPAKLEGAAGKPDTTAPIRLAPRREP